MDEEGREERARRYQAEAVRARESAQSFRDWRRRAELVKIAEIYEELAAELLLAPPGPDSM